MKVLRHNKFYVHIHIKLYFHANYFDNLYLTLVNFFYFVFSQISIIFPTYFLYFTQLICNSSISPLCNSWNSLSIKLLESVWKLKHCWHTRQVHFLHFLFVHNKNTDFSSFFLISYSQQLRQQTTSSSSVIAFILMYSWSNLYCLIKAIKWI